MGKKYYYKNGKKLTDLHKIGKYYYCFAADGAMLTGWHRIHNRFRYFGKQTGRMRINQTVNGRKINSKGVWTPVIVLDPGHSAVVAGGYEPLGPGSSQLKEKDTSGTQGVATGVEEYKLNLSIGLQLRTLLQKRGFKVIMTRTNSKVALSCIDRAKVANKANADAYIRIHANGRYTLGSDRASSKGYIVRWVEAPSNKLLTTAFEASLESVTVTCRLSVDSKIAGIAMEHRNPKVSEGRHRGQGGRQYMHLSLW